MPPSPDSYHFFKLNTKWLIIFKIDSRTLNIHKCVSALLLNYFVGPNHHVHACISLGPKPRWFWLDTLTHVIVVPIGYGHQELIIHEEKTCVNNHKLS